MLFRSLNHSFIIGNSFGYVFDPQKERQSNDNVRRMIEKAKESVLTHVNQSIPDAASKAKYYIAALEAQLEVCKKIDKIIDRLGGLR